MAKTGYCGDVTVDNKRMRNPISSLSFRTQPQFLRNEVRVTDWLSGARMARAHAVIAKWRGHNFLVGLRDSCFKETYFALSLFLQSLFMKVEVNSNLIKLWIGQNCGPTLYPEDG